MGFVAEVDKGPDLDGILRARLELLQELQEAGIEPDLATSYSIDLGRDMENGLPRFVAVRRIFDEGGEMVRITRPGTSTYFRPPATALVKTWEEFLRSFNYQPYMSGGSSFATEDQARLLHGYKRPYDQPRYQRRDERVAAEAEKLRIEREAKRKVADESNPVQELKLISLDDLQNAPAPDWWINGFIPKNAIVVVGGDGGVGKSATLVEMSARLTTATPFLGEYGTRKARVLYAVGEGMSGYRPRLEAVAVSHGLNPEQFRLVEGISLTSDRSVAQLAQTVAAGKVDVVIFDTLSSLTTLESENDAAEVARVIGAAKRIREANEGCTAIIVHHTSKGSGGLRGSSVIRDNADAVWMLKGDSDAFFMSNKSKHGGKMKDGAEIEVHGLSLVPTLGSIVVETAHESRGVQPDARSGPSLIARMERGVEYDRATLFELARRDQPDVSDSTVKRLVTSLSSDGAILRIGHGRYALPKGSSKGSQL